MKRNCGLEDGPVGHLSDVFRDQADAFFFLSDMTPSR